MLNLGCIKSLNSYAIHFLINKLFIYKGDIFLWLKFLNVIGIMYFFMLFATNYSMCHWNHWEHSLKLILVSFLPFCYLTQIAVVWGQPVKKDHIVNTQVVILTGMCILNLSQQATCLIRLCFLPKEVFWNPSIRTTPFAELLWPLLRGGHFWGVYLVKNNWLA